ncbi:TadE family type IV pilus minor pilin [Sphaerimonospora sp. CA-214678]|uniref:TadE family type IV pilus minor pilin n=1 Tax=Sphaerimonospora sp. CA-214678 TaxID=3240029 RepID=UPI003D8FCDF9
MMARTMQGGRRAGPREHGSATAETAVVLPVLVMVLAAALWAITVVGAQLRCVDAARTGARAAARGEALDAVRLEVLRAAPAGSRVVVDPGPEVTRVDVSVRVRPPWKSGFGSVEVTASAASATESGVFQ